MSAHAPLDFGLFAPPGETTPSKADADLNARFWAFHERHPQVYRVLRRRALSELAAARARGRRMPGLKKIAEDARYDVELIVDGRDESEPFKINNTHVSRFARLLDEWEPELRGVFEFRGELPGFVIPPKPESMRRAS